MGFDMSYTNSKGETFGFKGDPNWYAECDIRDYSWDYEISDGEVVRMHRDAQKATIPVSVGGGAANRDKMVKVFERDVSALKPGILSCGEWKRRCFVVGVSSSGGWYSPNRMSFSVDVILIDSKWYKYTETEFSIREESATGGLNFPYNYPHNLGCGNASNGITVDAIEDCDFRLTIFGWAQSPYVTIGSNVYLVNANLATGDYMVIDSRDKVIEIHENGGYTGDAFAKRQKGLEGSGKYIFQKIIPGYNTIAWDNTFGFNLGVYTASSSPEWGPEYA